MQLTEEGVKTVMRLKELEPAVQRVIKDNNLSSYIHREGAYSCEYFPETPCIIWNGFSDYIDLEKLKYYVEKVKKTLPLFPEPGIITFVHKGAKIQYDTTSGILQI